MVMRAMTRAVRRLAALRRSPTCSVLNAAPTGAAAIAMGTDANTIDSLFPSVVPRGKKREAARATAFDNALSTERLQRLRALVGGGPWPFTLRLLNLDEQSMINLAHSRTHSRWPCALAVMSAVSPSG